MNKRILKKKLAKDMVILPLSPLIVFPGKPKWKRRNARVHYKLQREIWTISCVTVTRMPNKNNRIYDKELLERAIENTQFDMPQTLTEHPFDNDPSKQPLN